MAFTIPCFVDAEPMLMMTAVALARLTVTVAPVPVETIWMVMLFPSAPVSPAV